MTAEVTLDDLAKALSSGLGRPIDAQTMANVLARVGASAPGTSPQVQVPGIFNRLKAGIQYVISGVGPSNFFGPFQPIRPIADKPEQGVIGRQFDFEVGENIKIQPRASEPVTFAQLRSLADNYDLLRGGLETVKDNLKSVEWEIVPKDPKADAKQFADEIRRVSEFFAKPDREHDWDDWLNMLSEDMLVIDAVAIFPTQSRGGDTYSFDLVDGGTIKRLIDEYGRSPMAPDPAYSQVIKGVPAVFYNRDELCYWVRNPRTNRLYGLSPVEQIIMTVNIAMRRQIHLLQFYTEGNIPEMLVSVPDTWTAKMIKEFQEFFDSMLEGNTAARRHLRFLPSLKDGKIIEPKLGALKDDLDEWLARIICWILSIPPNALIKQMNRASGQQMADTAKEEGLLPKLRWLERKLTTLCSAYLKAPNVRFSFKTQTEVDPAVQAKNDQIYFDVAALTSDEIREASLGRAPLTPEERAKAFPNPPLPIAGGAGQAAGPGGEGAPGGEQPQQGGMPPLKGGQPGKEPPSKGTPAEKQEAEKAEQFNLTVHLPPNEQPIAKAAPRIPAPVVHVHPPNITLHVDEREGKVTKKMNVKRLPDGSFEGVVERVSG